MDKLIDGYKRFRAGHWVNHKSEYEGLNAGQSPGTCVISCCDSRVDPVAIFDAHPGELFVIRNVANLVPPYRATEGLQGTSTAIEFAVRYLKVGLILVLGHARCGGVGAALQPQQVEDTVFLRQWINLLEVAKQRAGAADQDTLEHVSVQVSLERLMTFPFVEAAVRAGTLKLAGARFSIFDGQLAVLDHVSGKFSKVA